MTMKPGALMAILCAALALAACDTSKPPKPKAAVAADTHPVKNVEALPSGTIQEGARTMNRAADMSNNLEQQKQQRQDEAEARDK